MRIIQNDTSCWKSNSIAYQGQALPLTKKFHRLLQIKAPHRRSLGLDLFWIFYGPVFIEAVALALILLPIAEFWSTGNSAHIFITLFELCIAGPTAVKLVQLKPVTLVRRLSEHNSGCQNTVRRNVVELKFSEVLGLLFRRKTKKLIQDLPSIAIKMGD